MLTMWPLAGCCKPSPKTYSNRPITCLVVWLGFMGMAWSQSEPSLPWTFKGGLVGRNNVPNPRRQGRRFNKFGLHGGPVGNRRYANLGLQLGIVYNEKGSRKVQYPKIGDFTTWRYKFSYFDIPITAIYDWRDGITVGAGLQPSVLINALEDGISTGSVTVTGTPPPSRSASTSCMGVVGRNEATNRAMVCATHAKPAEHCPKA